MKMLKLFDDDVGDGEEIEKIEIDEEFAKRYEHNKTREDLERYEELRRRGEIRPTFESESDSESESDEVNHAKLFDGKFFEGILKIKKKDPILFQKDARLFDDDDDDDKNGGGERKKEKKEKKTYLKDVIARNLIEEGPEFDDEAAEAAAEKAVVEKEKVKSFVEEQEDLRNEVLAALAAEDERGNEDGGDGFLKEKEKERDGGEEEREDEVLVEKLDVFFGKDEKLDENNKFLKDFFKNKLWIDKGNNNVVDEEDLDRVSDDEQDIYAQFDFEREYNFRFQETSDDRVQGHSRVVEGSVRKETNPRKEQRKRKKERMEAAELVRREEVKRLKNVKRKELQEKLNKIREVAGVDGEVIPLVEADLEKDFDPDEFDMKMKSTFGEEYYEAEDADPEFGKENCEGEDLEKPDFDKEDELLGLPKNWDVIKSSDGFLAKREQRKKSKQEAGIEDDYEEEEEEEEEEGEEGDEKSEEGKRKRKRKSKLAEALKKELEEELYKYDYEDAIGDLKTRFKYRKVKPDRYKLSAAEILWLDEQELNQYVSLKKLATYREQEWKVPSMRKQMLIDGRLSTQSKGKTKEKKRVDGEGPCNAVDDGKPEEEKEETKLSRAARRRKNQKAKRLPDSRRVAYGEIAPSKKKSKH